MSFLSSCSNRFHDEDNEDDVFDGEDEADDLHQVERSSPVYDKVCHHFYNNSTTKFLT